MPTIAVLWAIGSILGTAICGIVMIAVLRPEKDNAALYTTIGGLVVPTIAAMLALLQVQQTDAKVQELDVKVDGRLTKLLTLTEQSALARGELVGRDLIKSENPDLYDGDPSTTGRATTPGKTDLKVDVKTSKGKVLEVEGVGTSDVTVTEKKK